MKPHHQAVADRLAASLRDQVDLMDGPSRRWAVCFFEMELAMLDAIADSPDPAAAFVVVRDQLKQFLATEVSQ